MKYIYEFCLMDWDVYEPHWFECPCSKEEFEDECKKAIEDYLVNIEKKHHKDNISCTKMSQKVVEVLSKKFKEIKPSFRVQIPLSFPMDVLLERHEWEQWPDVMSQRSKEIIVNSYRDEQDEDAFVGTDGDDDVADF